MSMIVTGAVALGGQVADILRRRAAEHPVIGDHLEPGLPQGGELFRIVGHDPHGR